MNAEQVSELIRAEVTRALGAQKLGFDKKILAILSKLALGKPRVENSRSLP